ncbi:MAG TPA: response regulator, partial [Blastocatellia bacterium]|nr:response regulator [Blastocatellia bacterium]
MTVTNVALSLPKEVIATVEGKRLALIGFNHADTAELTGALDEARAFSRNFREGEMPPGDAALQPFDLVVVNMQHEGEGGSWLQPEKLASNTKPLLLIGPSELLFQHVPPAQTNTYDFLTTPLCVEEVVLRIYHILTEVARKRTQRNTLSNGKMRVLIADDDSTTTTLVSALVKKYGMECLVARDGGEAIALSRELEPDAAILDVNMPHFDGFEVLMALKTDPRLSHIHIILLTSRQQETDIIRGFGLGADDYVVKPFNPMELVARL